MAILGGGKRTKQGKRRKLGIRKIRYDIFKQK